MDSVDAFFIGLLAGTLLGQMIIVLAFDMWTWRQK